MFDQVNLRSLISSARSGIRLPATIIKTPAILKRAVERQEFLNEVDKLEMMLTLLPEEEVVKVRFAELCYEREVQNRGTLLHFTSNPDSKCNQLFFDVAKVLYPEATYLQIFGYLLPMLTSIWVLKAHVAKGASGRRELGLDLMEAPIDSEEASAYLASVAEHSDVFKRILLVGNSLFSLDEIAVFDFKTHCKFHQLLMDKALPLKRSLILHNEALAELYNTIEQLQGDGGSLHDFFLSVLNHMEGAGEYFGSVDYAKDEGSDAAHRLYRYYETLPVDVKDSLNECRSSTGDTFLKIVKEIEKGECIETVTRMLHEILINPTNLEVLNIRPYLTQEQSDALVKPYVVGRQKGVSLVELDGKFNTTSYPESLVRYFYQNVIFEAPDEVASYLVDFQPDQYELILSEATIDIEDFEYCLELILPVLNETQYLAFLRAMGSNKDKFDLRSLLCSCVNMKDVRGLQVLLECVSPESRLGVVIEGDDDGLSVSFCAMEDIDCLCMLLSCLPNNDRLRPLLMDYDDQPSIYIISKNLESLKKIISVLENSDRLIALTGLIKCLNREECLRIQGNQDIRTCFDDGNLRTFDKLFIDKLAVLSDTHFGFFERFSTELSEEDDDELLEVVIGP